MTNPRTQMVVGGVHQEVYSMTRFKTISESYSTCQNHIAQPYGGEQEEGHPSPLTSRGRRRWETEVDPGGTHADDPRRLGQTAPDGGRVCHPVSPGWATGFWWMVTTNLLSLFSSSLRSGNRWCRGGPETHRI